LRRSNQKRGKQADEHGGNQCRMGEHWSATNELTQLIFWKGFGLRSASGESGAEGGEERFANRSRSETSRRRAADGSPPLLAANTNAARDERAVCIEAKRCKPCVGRGGQAGLT
jgi:hypothetical protein